MTEEAQLTTESTAEPQTDGPSWYIDEGIAGSGERPEWLPKKYSKASDLGRGYSELEKKLGGFTGAPEEYDLTDLELDDSQLIVKEWKSLGKELNMSQDALKKFIARTATTLETESELNIEQQVKALGVDGERQLKQYREWTRDHFKPEEAKVVAEWVKTADDLKVINKIMASASMSVVPTGDRMPAATYETVAELRQEMVENVAKYENDKSYRANFSARLRKANAREG